MWVTGKGGEMCASEKEFIGMGLGIDSSKHSTLTNYAMASLAGKSRRGEGEREGRHIWLVERIVWTRPAS